MASTTTNLGLTKPAYSDDADISDINGNMDLIDAEAGKVRANVAANYDSSETYAVGDYCLHDGSLYKCTTAISSPESWTAGHWTQIKIAGELSSLTDHIATKDLSNAVTNVDTSHVDNIKVFKTGNVVYIYFRVLSGATNSSTLFQLPATIQPITNASATLLIASNGKPNVDGAIWIESANKDKVKYYGDTVTAQSYASLTYISLQ